MSDQKKLVIVESPTKAKTIRKFLGKNYIVESGMGHIRDLPQSAKDIPEKYKKEAWSKLGVNVEDNFDPIYCVPKNKTKVVKELKTKLADADELILATDEDRDLERELFETIEPDPDDGRTHISSSCSSSALHAHTHSLSVSLSHCRYLAARVGPRAQGGALPVGAVHGPRRARLAAVHGLLPHRTCRYVDREDLSAARARCRQLCELGRVQGGWESDCGGLVGGAKLP